MFLSQNVLQEQTKQAFLKSVSENILTAVKRGRYSLEIEVHHIPIDVIDQLVITLNNLKCHTKVYNKSIEKRGDIKMLEISWA